jgi:hypothetical protein
MFYLIINEQIRKYIDMIKDKHFGCKKYCPLQIIALDEMELLRKELKKIDIILSDEEYKHLLKSSEPKYFNSVHICITPEEEKKREEAREMQKYLELSKEDRIPKKETNAFIDLEQFEKNYKERKKHDEEEEKLFNNKNRQNIDRTGNSFASITNGFSMIISFFLLVIGSYYLGKYFFGLSDSNTLKLVLVITIIVFLSETCLLLLSFHKEDLKRQKEGIKTGQNGYYSDSFAYRFNRNYRNTVNQRYDRKYKQKID